MNDGPTITIEQRPGCLGEGCGCLAVCFLVIPGILLLMGIVIGWFQ